MRGWVPLGGGGEGYNRRDLWQVPPPFFAPLSLLSILDR